MATRGANWVWYGGRPSLDFVNTRRDRHGAGVEYLTGPDELAAWLLAVGAEADPGHRDNLIGEVIDDVLFDEAVQLREAIDAAVGAAVTGRPVPSAALRVLNRWLAEPATDPPRLHTTGGITVLRSDHDHPRDARHALGRLALDAAQLIGTDQRDRLRICPGSGCGGRFLDQSPAGRRRWCSMAVCGNRHKASTHRHARHPIN
jgi:predicted RNA-binding Zn ribbon-like protein